MDEDIQKQLKVKRVRKRKDSLKLDKSDVEARIQRFYDDDTEARTDDMELRLQRYAKYRGWTEGKNWPWDNCSDAFIPDMMTNSLRVQDTLYNAVISTRPVITSKALKKSDEEKQEKIDSLIDYQLFVEQKGETLIGELAELFVNDGVFTVFVPWVREDRGISDIRIFPPIPDEILPIEYFLILLQSEFGNLDYRKKKSDWDWEIIGEKTDISFYSREDGRIEMVIRKVERVFDGPRPIVKDYEDVITPPRCANLQMPSPSNPGGASHVILSDYPGVDEIARLKKSGFYDLMTQEDLDELEGVSESVASDRAKNQKDDLSGVVNKESFDKKHKTVTRLMVFDVYDIDGDGIGEDVIFWYILETKKLVKAKILTEMYPFSPPRRPLAESQFLPVKGRRSGVSLLEIMEGVHDMVKTTYDQMVDAGTLANTPFGFYRASSSMKPEVMRLSPGELYPLGDPSKDVHFPNFNNQSQSFGLNLISVLNQMEEKLTMVGDLQYGRVPQGKASALRTLGGMQSVLGQGESRPERILRRFFIGLSEVYHQVHELNKHFLPKNKQYRILGYDTELDPYQEITDTQQIDGRFTFDFSANILNSSKGALGQSLTNLMSTFVSQLTFQSGIMDQEGFYKLLSDYGKSQGVDSKRYLRKPSKDSDKPHIMFEDAISSILDGQMPYGKPAEGYQEHLQKLMEFTKSPEMGLLNETGVGLFQAYITDVHAGARDEIAMQQRVAAAAQFQGQPVQSGAPQAVDQSPPPVQGEELIDETLPANGRG